MKLVITESKTCRSYSKLFLPLSMQIEATDTEGIKKEVEAEFKINKKMMEDPSFRLNLKNLIHEYALNILYKNPQVKQYEDIGSFLNKLLS